MNIVALTGRLVADPELKITPQGISVCTMRIAVDRRFKSESGEKVSDFFNLVAWRQSADYSANFLHKGSLVAVNGSLQSRSWVAQDGSKRYATEVVVDSIQGMDKGEKKQEQVNDSPAEVDSELDYDPFA